LARKRIPINSENMNIVSSNGWLRFTRPSIVIFIPFVFAFLCAKDTNLWPVTNSRVSANTAAKKDPENNSSESKPATLTLFKASAPIVLKGAHDLTISGDSINGGDITCINLTNCYNIRITKCKLQNSTRQGIYMYGCRNIIIDGCYLTNVLNGVLVSTSTGVQILNNSFLNVNHDYVQFDAVTGGGNKILRNKGQNVYGRSAPEDGINIYKSSGTTADPIVIMYNELRGGGPSRSGGGIVLGDGGGSNQIAEYNSCVNTGQYGIGVGGGTNCQILNNNIYGAKFAWSSNGIEVNAFNNPMNGCSIITVSGNKVNWTNNAGVSSPYWNANNCGIVAGISTNNFKAKISAGIVPAW
jgi:parallel beta-helix repeat protein